MIKPIMKYAITTPKNLQEHYTVIILIGDLTINNCEVLLGQSTHKNIKMIPAIPGATPPAAPPLGGMLALNSCMCLLTIIS